MFRKENLLKDRSRCSVPRGEIWIGSAFLERAGYEDTLDNHFRIASQLGQDIVSLPVLEKSQANNGVGYRYFEPGELSPDLSDRTRFLIAVIDGPFQRMVNQRGLLEVLKGWGRDKESTRSKYMNEQKHSLELIDCCLERGFDAIVLADDLAGEQGPLIKPTDLDKVCTHFYRQAVSLVRKAGAFVFLHCCGNLKQLLPMIKSWSLDGLAAIQICKNDLCLLSTEIGGLMFSGIEASLLEKDSVSSEEMKDLKHLVSSVFGHEQLILCSSSGLYKADFWGRLQNIYKELDKDFLASQQ